MKWYSPQIIVVGVSYFIRDNLEAKVISFPSSNGGRVMLINVIIKETLITLVNIYPPTKRSDYLLYIFNL